MPHQGLRLRLIQAEGFLMPKPSRATFNPVANETGVSWNCTKCGASGLGDDRADAGKKFDKHDCEG